MSYDTSTIPLGLESNRLGYVEVKGRITSQEIYNTLDKPYLNNGVEFNWSAALHAMANDTILSRNSRLTEHLLDNANIDSQTLSLQTQMNMLASILLHHPHPLHIIKYILPIDIEIITRMLAIPDEGDDGILMRKIMAMGHILPVIPRALT